MAATTTTTLSNSVVADHLQTEFLIAASAQERWDQFAWVPASGAVAPGSDGTATTQNIVIYRNLALVASTIAEATDIEGVQLGDTSIDVALGEYGNSAQDTKRLVALGRTDIPSVFQAVIGRNAGLSQDVIARSTFIGGDLFRRPTPADTRADLDLTADDMQAAGFSFFYSLAAQLRSAGAPGLGTQSEASARAQGSAEPGVDYGTVVHDLLTGDLIETSGFTPIQYIAAPDARQQVYNGEFGRMAGIRIIESSLGKIYQSAGTIAQAATSLSAATTVGATVTTVATATGLVAGDYMTIGAVETAATELTTQETCLITTVSGTTTFTVIGAGPEGGLRYAHAAATACTEGAFVAAIPVFGGMSVAKVHSTICGPKPTMVETGPFDKLGRFKNYGWWWMGGYHVTVPTWLIRGEVAVNGKAIMAYGT